MKIAARRPAWSSLGAGIVGASVADHRGSHGASVVRRRSRRASWRTTCTLRALRRGGGSCIDSPVLPDELEDRWPRSRSRRASGSSGDRLIHADCDHVARAATPSGRRRRASACRPTGACRPSRGACTEVLRDFDEAWYLERAGPADDAGAAGAAGAGAVRDRRPGARAAPRARPYRRRHGDLDPVGARAGVRRLPARRSRSRGCRRRGSREDYLETLDRLEPLVEQAEHVVPGHGTRARPGARGGDPARGPRVPPGPAGLEAAAARAGRARRRTSTPRT